MKILWITLESILPANTGGRIGVFKRLEQISKSADIYLFYTYDSDDEKKYINELNSYCKEVHGYCRKDNVLNAVFKLYKYPFTVGSRCIKQLQNDIKNCLEDNDIDVINVDFPHMCVNLQNIKIDIPIVLNEHNIEWRVYKRIAKSQKNLLKKFAYFVDSYRLKSYEENLLKSIDFSAYTFVSDEDMDYFYNEHHINKSLCHYVPIGADVKSIKEKHENDTKNIIFVGKMSYGPNIEAVVRFAKKIFPIIKSDIGNVKFTIVGREPDKQVVDLASEDIIVTGSVDSVEPYYWDADLVVIPLINGGGAKIKLLEAISYCRPIVSTSVGVEGTEFRNNGLINVCDDEEDFAFQCLEYLNDKDKSEEISEKAYKYFNEGYSWERIGSQYLEIIEKLEKNKNGEERISCNTFIQ